MQPPRPYASLIQNFTRFALDHMATESWANGHQAQPWLMAPPPPSATGGRDPNGLAPSVVSQILGLDFKQTTACLVCGAKSTRPILQHTLDLAYPRQVRQILLLRLRLSALVDPCASFAQGPIERAPAGTRLLLGPPADGHPRLNDEGRL